MRPGGLFALDILDGGQPMEAAMEAAMETAHLCQLIEVDK
jgi:hypothetical protein